jgi:hypothetical protein
MPTLRPGCVRGLQVLLAVLLALPAIQAARCLAVEDNSGCMDQESCCCPPPRCPWYVREEGVLLTRRAQENPNLAFFGQQGTPGATLALDLDDLDERFTGGGRLLIGHTFGDSPYQFEISYLWQRAWDRSASVNDLTSLLSNVPGTLFTPFTGFGNPPDTRVDYDNYVQIHEISSMGTGEINFKVAVPAPPWAATTVLIGVRHLGISEQFDYVSLPTTTLQDPTVVTARTLNTVTAHTSNDLWGPQIGGMVEFSGGPNIWLSLQAKGAVCENGAARTLDATIADTTYPRDRVFQYGTAYVGDCDVTAFWRPCNFMTARIGYQVLYASGVVLAAENFSQNLAALVDQTPKAPMDRNGKVLYHGPFAGVEFHW